MKGAV